MASRPGWVAVGLRLGAWDFASQEDTVNLVSRPRLEVATSFVLIGAEAMSRHGIEVATWDGLLELRPENLRL